MKTLVTGGLGFTGSHLVRRLLERGDEVHVIDRDAGLFYDDLREKGATIELGTVEDRKFCERSVEQAEPEVIFHLAAAFRQLNVNKAFYWNVNVEGTRYLADAAERIGTRRFVYCSTQGVHGHIAQPPGDETSPIAPADYYQYTKYEGERVLQEKVNANGFDAVTLRPTAIYGPGDPARFLMLFKRCRNGTFQMFGSGRTTYHPVYIDNLVDAFLLAAEAKDVKGETYIIGDEHYYTLNDLVTHVAASMHQKIEIRHWPFWPLWSSALVCEGVCYPLRISPPLFRRRVDWFRQVRAFRIEKAKRELGYQPGVGIKEGLKRTAEWYQEYGYL